MFSRRTGAKHLDDRVWATVESKFAGICREIAETADPGTLVFTAAHEAATLKTLQARFSGGRIRFTFWEALPSLSEFDFQRHIGEGTQTLLVPSRLAAEARRLVPLLRIGRLFSSSADAAPALHLIVAERAMLPAQDRDLVAFADSLPWRTTVRFHVSMEDALLTGAVPERIAALMKSLGWDGKGPFSSPSVTDLITVAQKYQKTRASAEKRSAALIGAGRKPTGKTTP